MGKGRVVITGATGMVGCYLIEHLLDEGYDDIRIIARSERSLKKLWNRVPCDCGVKIEYVSLFDIDVLREFFRGSAIVFSCAAIVDFGKHDPQTVISDNVRIAHCVAEAAYEAKVGRLVYISSVTTMEPALYPAMTTEESQMLTLLGKSPYTISKFYAENEVWRVSEKGLKVTIVNPSTILGAGAWKSHGTPIIFTIIDHTHWFSVDGVMGFVTARDVARMAVALSQKEEAVGERFILNSDNLPFYDLIKMISTSLGKRPPFIKVPSWLIKGMLKIVRGNELLNIVIERSAYDGSKAERVSGISYTPINEEIANIAKIYINEKRSSKKSE